MQFEYETDSDSSGLEYEDVAMPAPSGPSLRVRGRGRGSIKDTAGIPGGKSGHSNSSVGAGRLTRTRRDEFGDRKTTEIADPEEKLASLLTDVLVEHSRQRLRATHMTLRRYATVESRVSQKDMHQALQENQMKFPVRLLQMISEIYEDHVGVDYERLYKCLKKAHLKTGRDSVRARTLRNDLSAKQEMSKEQQNNDFLIRLEEQLVKDNVFFDIESLRKEFQSKDTHRTGKIPRETMMLISNTRTPLYGALLKNLMKRCDEEKNEMISWPEFLNFLEKSQQCAWKRHPEMSELPEKARLAAQAVISNPIEELSSGAKSRVVSRLLKRKEKSTLSVQSRENSTVEPQAVKTKPPPAAAAKEVPAVEVAKETPPKQEPAPKIMAPAKTKATTGSTEKETKTASKDKPPSKEKNVKQTSKPQESPAVAAAPVIAVVKPPEEVVPKKDVPKRAAPKPPPPEPDLDDTNKHSVHMEVHGRKVKVVQPPTYRDSSLPVDPPKERLHLDWVYGYRGNDCRSNIHTLSNGDIVYFISNVAVLYNREAHTQRHYREHNEDIKCMAIHSNGNIVATGQFAGKKDPKRQAHIRVWRADSVSTMHVLGLGEFYKSVMCLAFQKDTDFLAAVDNSQEKKLTLWNAASGSHIADTVLHAEVICDIGFNPHFPELLVSIGKEHLAWWKMYPETNKITSHAKPEYDNYLRAKYIISLGHTDKGDLITGDSNGTIYIWGDGGNRITNFVKHGHDGPVFTVLYYRHHVVSGGRDGMMYSWQWTKNMDCDGTIEISKSEGGVRMIQLHKETLLIGTTMNSLLSVSLPDKGAPLDGATLTTVPVTQGHFDELRGLATMPKSFISADFLTAGTDGIICKFNTDTHQPVWKIVMKGAMFLCADCSQDGKLIALGTHDGRLVILGLQEDMSVMEVFNNKISKERLDVVRLAPDLQSLAVGGHDRAVYVYSLQEKDEGTVAWEMVGKCKGHHAPITAIDWSSEKVKNTHFLRSSSAVPEQYFWNSETCQREEGKNAVLMGWSSKNCTLDYTVTGVWSSKQAKEGNITSIDVNRGKTVIAMGDNSGCLSLFRYPCPKDGAFSHTYKCHQNVQTVRFSPSDRYVITVGGRDVCIMQWQIV